MTYNTRKLQKSEPEGQTEKPSPAIDVPMMTELPMTPVSCLMLKRMNKIG